MSPLIDQRRVRPQSRGIAAGASRGRRCGQETLRRRDLDVLSWLGEQYGARTDQLEILLDCGPRTVQRVIARLRDTGLVTTRRLLVGEPAWVIPTSTGLRAAGHGFAAWQPRIGLLAHVAAANDVRLHVQARSPESEWVPERLLARDRHAGEHLPDGVVITDGRRIAIEVELTVKSQRRIHAILDELTRRFDAVLYFCAPGPHRQLTQLTETGRWPALGVRELPRLDTSAP
jgi:DNA-binding MarR family transcriptional regulator